MYQDFIIPYLCEAQHVLGRHTAHHQEPKTALVDVVHQLHVQQPSTYEKPEAASAVLGS
jgi:hypothetical protein